MKFRRKARRAFGGFKRRSSRSRSSGGSSNLITIGLMAVAYGALRPKIEAMIPASVSGMVGGYGDELLLGGAGYLASKGKLGNNSFIKNAGTAIFIVEATRVGSGLGSSMLGSGSTSTSNSNLLG